MNLDPQDIATLVAFLTAIGSLFVAWSSRRKNINDAAEAISRAAAGLIDPLEERIRTLQHDLENLTTENLKLRDWVRRQYEHITTLNAGFNILTQQVILLGGKPAVELPEPLDIFAEVLPGEGEYPMGGRSHLFSPDGGK